MNKMNFFHPSNFPGRGDIYIVFIMGIIVAASVYMIGGIIPDIEEQPAADAKEYTVSIEKPGKNPGIGMQLHELKSRPVPTVPMPTPQTPGEDPTTPTACSETMAVDFLVDISASMNGTGDGTAKIVNLRNALRAFYPGLSDQSIFGLTTFASDVQQRIPMQTYIDAKGQIAGEIERLQPGGATYMRDGFEEARDRMREIKDRYEDHTYNLIVISDGVPELDECRDPYCGNPNRNYDPSQDPLTSPNIASQIKALGINIYTIAIYNTEDLETSSKLQQIMRDASSGNGYYFESADAKNLSTILGQIKEKTCAT